MNALETMKVEVRYMSDIGVVQKIDNVWDLSVILPNGDRFTFALVRQASKFALRVKTDGPIGIASSQDAAEPKMSERDEGIFAGMGFMIFAFFSMSLISNDWEGAIRAVGVLLCVSVTYLVFRKVAKRWYS